MYDIAAKVVRHEFSIDGPIYDMTHFCVLLTERSRYMIDGIMKQQYSFTFSSQTNEISWLATYIHPVRIQVDDVVRNLMKKHFKWEPVVDAPPEFGIWSFPLTRPPTTGSNFYGKSMTSDNSALYNFDHIQLYTNLPVEETWSSSPEKSDWSASLGTIQTNPATEDAYYRGDLIYLPNFMVFSSLKSDLPLKDFEVTPIIYYKDGHARRLPMKPGDESYILLEFFEK